MDNRPIGILDSGVGGLTVWKEIISLLPNEETIYIGDSLNAPYGSKTPEEIFQLAIKLINFLSEKQVKLIVVACNTITVHGIEKLRALFPDIPIVGTVPVVKAAVGITKKKKIGIFSTTSTAKSDYQKRLIALFAKTITVINTGTDSLVPLIEKGIVSGEEIENILRKELQIFKDNDIDVLALGCTHYPYLKASIQKILGNHILLFDSGGAIARQVRHVLSNNSQLGESFSAKHSLFTTGIVEPFATMVSYLVGEEIPQVQRIVLQ